MSIGLKELLLLCAIIGGLVWVSMVRSNMEQKTARFMHKLKGPTHGDGFGWRGLLIAFILGITFCCLFAVIVLRIWTFYNPASAR